MLKKVDPISYNYQKLKAKYPHSNEFYEDYYEGDYYTRASTTFYDENKQKLECEMHSWYG